MTLRAAVIGLGSMGRNHVRHYNDMDEVELVAVADYNEAVLDWFKRRYRARGYTHYQEMLDRENLDIVSITVPTVLHRDVALDVIDRGLHLLVEKPIALSEVQGREIIEAAAAKGVKLTVGHVERFNPAIVRMKEEIKQGALGRVFHLHARRQSPYPRRIQDVGVTVDLAPHDIDVMRFLTDAQVTRIYAEVEHRMERERDDGLSCLLRFDNDALGLLEIDWLTPTKVREIAVSGERGMFIANYLTQALYFYENEGMNVEWDISRQFVAVSEGEMRRLHVKRKEPLRIELEDFVHAVAEGRDPLVSGEDGLHALSIAQAMLESGRKGQIMHLSGG